MLMFQILYHPNSLLLGIKCFLWMSAENSFVIAQLRFEYNTSRPASSEIM